ncbi:MAG: tryptophan synthase subunit alpha [Methanomassiliicoccales archaeon]
MPRISDAFATAKETGRSALITYIMGGDPEPARFIEYAAAVARHTDVLEVGIPFSDPIADGPTIQAASVRALASGTRVATVIEGCASLSHEVPVVIMCYYNTVHRFGEERFAAWLSTSEIAGLIVPDLPLELSRHLSKVCRRYGIDLVLLASPATSNERARKIAGSTAGFLYLLSRYGVTGERASLPEGIVQLVHRYKEISSQPVAVGFGISTKEHVHALVSAGADGVIVGSAVVSRIAERTPSMEIASFVSELRASTVISPAL